MAVLSTTTKGKVGVKAARGLAAHPRAAKAGVKLAVPVAKRPVRRRAVETADSMRALVDYLATYLPQAIEELGLVTPPKPKRTAPRVAVGMVIGASALYFLDPGHGREHREQVKQLVG